MVEAVHWFVKGVRRLVDLHLEVMVGLEGVLGFVEGEVPVVVGI